jgi:sirohydrochlorin cobaltochelatase
METPKQAVILIGHGGLPNDIPKEVVEDFMKIHKQRIRRGTPITSEEKDLETTIRKWERTPESDPYKVGLEKLADHLAPRLDGYILKTAYNEFCFPSIEQAADQLAEENITKVILITTMITPGGLHSEREITEEVEALCL